MLSSSRRPRAPSAAALRVLYQLAYITSGTALGVGVLCAEERRRRCKLVQKVADNARRLHSNPRYSRNAVVDQIDWTDDSNANFLLTRAALKSAAGVRAAGLPSVVDESYEKLIKSDAMRHKKRRRRRRKRDDESEEDVKSLLDNSVQRTSIRSEPPGFTDSSCSTACRTSPSFRRLQLSPSQNAPNSLNLARDTSADRRDSMSDSVINIATNSTSAFDFLEDLSTLPTPKTRSSHDFQHRQATAPKPRRVRRNSSHERAVASSKLQMTPTKTVTEQHEVPREIVSNIEHTTSQHIYEEDAIEPKFKPLLSMLSSTNYPQPIQQDCTALLKEGDLNAAIRLIISIPVSDRSLAHCLFLAALESRNIDLCIPILEWTGWSLEDNSMGLTEIEEFINLAVDSSTHKAVRMLFRVKDMSDANTIALQRLAREASFSQQCLVNICIAYAQQTGNKKKSHPIFKIAYDALSLQCRQQIRECCQEEYVRMLVNNWQLSRNLDEFMVEYRLALEQWTSTHQSAARYRLQLVAVKICSLAQKRELAREILQTMDSTDNTQTKLLAVGSVLAHQRDWSVLESLISEAVKHPASLEQSDDKKVIVEIMSEYSKYHECEQTVRFVFSIMKAFQQPTSRAAHLILLRASISNKRLDLLEAWSQKFSKEDTRFQFDASVVFLESSLQFQ